MKKLTEPRAKALAWLPSDGSFRAHESGIGRGINGLRFATGEKLVNTVPFRGGQRGGWVTVSWLTPAGVAFKAAREVGQ